jgi:Reverse transcriptase (RNA-dependent DNA polymerase)
MARDCRKKQAEQDRGKNKQPRTLRPCRHCGGKHMDNKCWELPENASRRPENWTSRRLSEQANVAQGRSAGPNVELLLNTMDDSLKTAPDDEDLWIGDTAATVHMTPTEDGMTKMRKVHGDITVGNGEVMTTTKQGDIPCQICDKSGKVMSSGIITDVALTENCPFNLFSLTKMMNKGWKLSGDSNGIKLNKGDKSLIFDVPIETPKGVVYAMRIHRTQRKEIATPALTTVMNVNKAHRLLGHQSESTTRKTAEYLGWRITRGTMEPCVPCTIGKAKQKNTVKVSQREKSKTPGERIFTDIASVRPKEDTQLSKPFWCIKVDERTQIKFSSFHKHKDEMVESSCELFDKWKQGGNPVKFIRCDNAGENQTLQHRANGVEWKLNIEFEYTPRDTPQHNHLAELGLASLANKGRSMMRAANVPINVRYKVWVKAFQHATDLDGLNVITLDEKVATRYEHWCGRLSKWVNHLRIWGEAGTVKMKTDTTPKIADRGIKCMFVGHARNHDGDCYEMWNPSTNKIYVTRDVIWLNRMYFDEEVIEGVIATQMLDIDGEIENMIDECDNEHGELEKSENSESEDKPNQDEEHETEDPDRDVVPTGVTRSGNTFRDIAACNLEQNPLKLTKAEINFRNRMNKINDMAFVGAGIGGGFENTTELHVMKYDAAMKSPDAGQWKRSVQEEHDRMVDNEVWTPVPKTEVPADAKVLTTTWAMKKKANGKYRARLNCRGFEQVPGLHYDPKSIAAPVVTMMTIRIVFVIMIMAGWTGHVLDVRGAFLKGNFGDGETLYVHVPQGMEKWYGDKVYLLLHKTIYGLKQAAYRFWVFLLQIVRKLNCVRSKADPCLYFKWTDTGALLLWFSWVDDCFITGPEIEVTKFKEELMSAVDCAQDMLYAMRIMESIGLMIKKNHEPDN